MSKNMFIITTDDGELHYTSTAASAEDALNALARDMDYPTYSAMQADLGYSHRAFNVVEVRDERKHVGDDRGDVLMLERQRSALKRATVAAFRAMRRAVSGGDGG